MAGVRRAHPIRKGDRMHRIAVLFLVGLLMLAPAVVVFAEDLAPKEESAAAEPKGAFEDWWGFFTARSGGLFNLETNEWQPYVTVPVAAYRKITGEFGVEFDVDEATEAHGPVAWVGGLTYDLGNLRDFGVEVSWAKYFGLNVGPYGRYDIQTRDWSGGIMVSVIDLSFDDGNVDRMRKK